MRNDWQDGFNTGVGNLTIMGELGAYERRKQMAAEKARLEKLSQPVSPRAPSRRQVAKWNKREAAANRRMEKANKAQERDLKREAKRDLQRQKEMRHARTAHANTSRSSATANSSHRPVVKSQRDGDWNYLWGGLGILMVVGAVMAFLEWSHAKVLSGLGMFGVTSPRAATIVMILDAALPLLVACLWWWRAGGVDREEVTMPLWIAALASTALLWMFSLFALFS